MPKIKNSLLITQVLEALFTVVARRTLDSLAVQILTTTIKKLETTFDYLAFIMIHDDFFCEEKIKATIHPAFDTIEPSSLGKAIDALIRVVYLEVTETIGDDVGFYFITELKENLGDAIVDELQRYGVNFEQIQTEQHRRFQMRGLKPRPLSFPSKEEENEPRYTWDTVSTWKYDNNVCFLYDEQGRLLDTLQLDLLIEDYVERVTKARTHHIVAPPETTMLKVTEKENELLEMMHQKDIDIEYAVVLLHMSRQKVDTMVQKLLKLEMLQYISNNEVKLTEKGLQHLSEHQTK